MKFDYINVKFNFKKLTLRQFTEKNEVEKGAYRDGGR